MSDFSNHKKDFLLDPNVVFLNHGSFGATPRPVFQKYQEWQRILENQPVELLGRKVNDLLYQSRAELAKYLHCSASNLVYVPNTTVGLNTIARSLSLHPGDTVLTTNLEYGAMDRMWRFLARKTGFTYRNIPIPVPFPPDDELVHIIDSHLSSEVKVLFLSHITSATALILPVETICKIAKRKGILTIVDGAHVPGHLPLDLSDPPFDFYVGNLHKWLCAPKGSAFLFATPEHQPLIEPLVVSWGYEPDYQVESPFIDLLQWTGTRDLAAYLSVPKAIEYQSERKWESVQTFCHQKAVILENEITKLAKTQSLYSSARQYQQMFSAQLPCSVDIIQLKTILYDTYRVEVPILTWQGMNSIRVSLQAYNSDEDCETLLHALRVTLKDSYE